MTRLTSTFRKLFAGLPLALAFGASFGSVACGADDAGAGAGSAGAGTGPAYLFNVAVYAPDGTLNYALLRDELDFDIDVNTLKTAREFPGYTGIAAIGGQIVTGDSETPFATKFDIGADLSWKQVGNKLNFSDYFMADADGLNFYFQSIRGADMNFFYGAERTSRVHWDTASWKIVGDHNDTKLPTRAGWTLGNTGNRTGVRDFKGGVMQSFVLTNDATDVCSDESWIAVYDPDTHEEKNVIEVPCPCLQQATLDEDGNVYFSTTFNTPTRHLYGLAPASCVVRVKPDGTLDEEFGVNDLTKWTGGFYGVNFRYLGNGKAVANVLHHDRLTDVDWTGEFDPAVETKISGQWTDDGYISEDRTLWEMHLIDLEKGTSEVVTGFAAEHDVSFYSIFFQVDGRVFVSVQFDEHEITNNAVYELDTSTGTVRSVAQVVGDLAGVQRVR